MLQGLLPCVATHPRGPLPVPTYTRPHAGGRKVLATAKAVGRAAATNGATATSTSQAEATEDALAAVYAESSASDGATVKVRALAARLRRFDWPQTAQPSLQADWSGPCGRELVDC